MKLSNAKLANVLIIVFAILVCEFIDILSQNYALNQTSAFIDGQYPFVWVYVYAWDTPSIHIDLSQLGSVLMVFYFLFCSIFSSKNNHIRYKFPLLFSITILLLEMVDFLAKLLASLTGSYDNAYHAYFFFWKRYRDVDFVWFINLANIFMLVSVVVLITRYFLNKNKQSKFTM